MEICSLNLETISYVTSVKNKSDTKKPSTSKFTRKTGCKKPSTSKFTRKSGCKTYISEFLTGNWKNVVTTKQTSRWIVTFYFQSSVCLMKGAVFLYPPTFQLSVGNMGREKKSE
mgnify:CR=1 FL=1